MKESENSFGDGIIGARERLNLFPFFAVPLLIPSFAAYTERAATAHTAQARTSSKRCAGCNGLRCGDVAVLIAGTGRGGGRTRPRKAWRGALGCSASCMYRRGTALTVTS